MSTEMQEQEVQTEPTHDEMLDLFVPEDEDAPAEPDHVSEDDVAEDDTEVEPEAPTSQEWPSEAKTAFMDLMKQNQELIRQLQGQHKPEQPTAPQRPDIDGFLEKQFDQNTAPRLRQLVSMIRDEVRAEMGAFLPKDEFEQFKPAITSAALTLGERQAVDSLIASGFDEATVKRGKAEADALIKEGKRFSDYESAYLAGIARAQQKAAQRKAVATQQGRGVKDQRKASGGVVTQNTPATRAPLRVSKEELLNDPFGVLDKMNGL